MLDTDNNERAVMGDNNPPAFDASIVATHQERVVEFNDKSKAWSKLEKVADEAMAKRLTDFVAGTRKLYASIEKDRKAAKKPHLDAGSSVDTAFKKLSDPVETMGKNAKVLLGAYLIAKDAREKEEREEKARLASIEEEAARKRLEEAAADNDVLATQEAEEAIQEAEETAKEAAKPVKTNVGSATGAGRTIALRTYREADIKNIGVCFLQYRKHPEVEALLTRLATADIRSKVITEENADKYGLKIKETQRAA